MGNKECKHKLVPVTSGKNYVATIWQQEIYDIDNIEESTIIGFICNKCKFTLSPPDFKEYNSFEKTKFEIRRTKLSSIISVIAIAIFIISFFIAILKKI